MVYGPSCYLRVLARLLDPCLLEVSFRRKEKPNYRNFEKCFRFFLCFLRPCSRRFLQDTHQKYSKKSSVHIVSSSHVFIVIKILLILSNQVIFSPPCFLFYLFFSSSPAPCHVPLTCLTNAGLAKPLLGVWKI